MSEVRLNLVDARAVINGTVHGSIADTVIAALSAEPESIAELELALDRFSRFNYRPFGSFRSGENTEPWDAGIVIVDLAARIIASESSYNQPSAQGEILYHDGKCATDVCLPYRIPEDWLILCSVLDYEARRKSRRAERDRRPRIDIRQVLYGKPLAEFIVNECLAERQRLGSKADLEDTSGRDGSSKPDNKEYLDSEEDDPTLTKLHCRWLMTPRSDLGNRSPRDVIVEKLSLIDFDLQSRELQWSTLNEGPPPLPRSSQAYLLGGFGTHEYVVYYDLLRYLLRECWNRISGEKSAQPNGASPKQPPAKAQSTPRKMFQRDVSPRADRADVSVDWLQEIKGAWLNSPSKELNGRIPIDIIESERRRIPLLSSAKDFLVDDCPLCQVLADDPGLEFGPGFCHFDGSHIDPLFEFSTYLTREEWEAEERKWQKYNEEFERRWSRKRKSAVTGSEFDDEDVPF